jgi:D-psicose/D-tagatose/L-ribulose 3-epimerase
MNKLGVHALVWVAGWSHDECARAVAQSAELGYDLIEIPALDPEAIDVDFTRRTLEQHHLGVTLSLGLEDAADVSSGDPAKMKRGEEKLAKVVAIARDLGATHVTGIIYSAFQKYFAPPTAAGIAGSVEVLRRVAERAAASHITLGVEVVNRYESNVLNTAAQAVEYVRRVGAPNLKIHLDTYHMNIEEADVEAAILGAGDHLGYFHIGESNRGYLGAGSVDWSRIFRGLARARYAGPITFESFSSKVVGQPLEGILGIWRNLWDDGRDLARHARAFMEAQLLAARETATVRGRLF